MTFKEAYKKIVLPWEGTKYHTLYSLKSWWRNYGNTYVWYSDIETKKMKCLDIGPHLKDMSYENFVELRAITHKLLKEKQMQIKLDEMKRDFE